MMWQSIYVVFNCTVNAYYNLYAVNLLDGYENHSKLQIPYTLAIWNIVKQWHGFVNSHLVECAAFWAPHKA